MTGAKKVFCSTFGLNLTKFCYFFAFLPSWKWPCQPDCGQRCELLQYEITTKWGYVSKRGYAVTRIIFSDVNRGLNYKKVFNDSKDGIFSRILIMLWHSRVYEFKKWQWESRRPVKSRKSAQKRKKKMFCQQRYMNCGLKWNSIQIWN